MKVIGILLLIGAGIFGVITLSEFSRYQELVNDGNPFAGLISNSYVYCGGIAMTAGLAGIGFLLVPSRGKLAQQAVAPPQYPPTPQLPPATPTT